MLLEDHQVWLFNLGINDSPKIVKLNATLDELVTRNTKALLQEYKDIFAWNYINFKRIPPCIVQHQIEFDITIPHVHQVRYQMNPNYVVVVKQDLDKLLNVGFIALMEEVNWLSPFIVVLKKNGKFRIYVDLWWLNAATKKYTYPLSFIEGVLDEVANHEVDDLFLDAFSNYHQIIVTFEDRYKTAFTIDWGAFIWVIMPFGLKNAPPTYQWIVNTIFKDYLGVFMKLFIDDFSMFNDLYTHLPKLWLCFN